MTLAAPLMDNHLPVEPRPDVVVPAWTPATTALPEVEEMLNRCHKAWWTAKTTFGFAGILVLTTVLPLSSAARETGSGSILFAVAGVLATLALLGGISALTRARLTDAEQARLAVSLLPPAAKATLAMGLDQGLFRFHRVLPVVLDYIASTQPGSRALGRFKHPRAPG